MADLFPNLHLPKIDFSGIAEIPGLIKGAQDEATTKAALSDLNATDAKSMRAEANRLLATGTTQGIEVGMRLLTAAQAKENADITRARDAQYMTSVGPALTAILGAKGAGTPGAAPAVEGPTPSFGPGPEAPATPPPVAPAPPVGISPSQLPAPPPGVAPMAPRAEAPSPSNEMIAQAQGALVPPPPGPQLAGPPEAMTPQGGPPGAVPFTGGPDMTRAGGLPPPPQAAPVAAPVAPPPMAPQMPAAPGAASEERVNQLTAAQASLSPRAVGQRQAIAQAAKNAMANDPTKSAEYKQYYNDQADRFTHGQPTQSIVDWRAEVKNAPALTEKAHDIYAKDYREKDRQATSLGTSLTAMSSIMSDPKFAPGEPGLIDAGTKKIAEINDKLRSIGVPEERLLSREQIKTLTTPAALREAFTAISNQAVIAALGGLGRQISDPDRQYMAQAFPSLLMSKRGSEFVMKFLSEVSDRNKYQAEVARKYLDDNQRATPAKMDQAVNNAMIKKYGSQGLLSYENGNPTQLKLQMDQALAPRVKPGDRVMGPGGVPHVIGPDGVPRPIGQQAM